MMIEIFFTAISSVLIGILASYVASKIFLYNNNKQNKPKILISDKLIKSQRKDGTQSLQVKLINKTDQDLTNVCISLEGTSNLAPTGSIPLIFLYSLTARKLMYIKKCDTDDKNVEYAHITKLYMDDKDIHKEYLKHQTIRLSITADCPYYNTSSIVTKDYMVVTDILDENHRFNTGDSLSISTDNV